MIKNRKSRLILTGSAMLIANAVVGSVVPQNVNAVDWKEVLKNWFNVLYLWAFGAYYRQAYVEKSDKIKQLISEKFNISKDDQVVLKKQNAVSTATYEIKVGDYKFPIDVNVIFDAGGKDYRAEIKAFDKSYTVKTDDDWDEIKREIDEYVKSSKRREEKKKKIDESIKRVRQFIGKHFKLTGSCYWGKSGYWRVLKEKDYAFSMVSKVKISDYEFPIEVKTSFDGENSDDEVVIKVFGKSYTIKTEDDLRKIEKDLICKYTTVKEDINKIKEISKKYSLKFFEGENSQNFRMVLPKNFSFEFSGIFVDEIYYDVKSSSFSLHCVGKDSAKKAVAASDFLGAQPVVNADEKDQENITVEENKEKNGLWKDLLKQKSKFNLSLLDGIRDSLSSAVEGIEWEEDDIEDTDDKYYERVGSFKIGDLDMPVSLKMVTTDDGSYFGCKVVFGGRWNNSCIFLNSCDKDILSKKIEEIKGAYNKAMEQFEKFRKTGKFGEIKKFSRKSSYLMISPNEGINLKISMDGKMTDDGYRIKKICFYPAKNEYRVYYDYNGPNRKFYEEELHFSFCVSFEGMSEKCNTFFEEISSKLKSFGNNVGKSSSFDTH